MTVIVTLATIGVIGLLFANTATSFLPEEDQGIIFANVQLEDTATINQTNELLAQISEQSMQIKGVKYFISVAGYSILGGSGENVALGVIGLDEWSQRKSKNLSIEAITAALRRKFADNEQAAINFLPLRQFPASAKATVCRWNCCQPTAMLLLPNFTAGWKIFGCVEQIADGGLCLQHFYFRHAARLS